jgi:hypothetical protein
MFTPSATPQWVPVGLQIPLNQPAININNGVATVIFGPNPITAGTGASSVEAYFFPESSSVHGVNILFYPTPSGSAAASASGSSLLFNPPQFNGTTNPNVQPIEWATLNSSGVITGYTTPYASATQHYQMSVVCSLVIPAPGSYTISFNHDDGAFFGFGPGTAKAQQPTITGGGTSNVGQTQTSIQGYPVMAGTNKAGYWTDNAVINFPVADTYGLEICYAQYVNEQSLTFQINGANPFPGSTSNPGEITATLGKYYWFTNADQTTGRITESSTSPISLVTGPLVGATVDVYQQPGLFSSSTASKTVTGTNSSDNPGPVSPELDATMAGKVIYINGTLIGTIVGVGGGTSLTLSAAGTPDVNGNQTFTGTITGGANNALIGTLQSITGFTNTSNNVTDQVVLASTATTLVINNPSGIAETHAATATSPANTLYLTANAAANETDGRAVICDARATYWHVYASESDGSKLGQFLQIPTTYGAPVTQNLSSSPVVDSSPFIDNIANQYLPIYRPVRNDPPPPSKLLAIHKVRQFRRREAQPNFFNFTANEEVTSGNNGDPAQCVPGADVNTVSDMVNEVSYPDDSVQIRGFQSHNDALYMFSEKQCFPLYGQSVDDFAISQVQAFACGLAGRFAVNSTQHGMPFITYDRKAQLFPMQSTIWSLNPTNVNATSALQEIGKPLRNVLRTADPNRLDEIVTCFYYYGIRDWWVISFPLTAGGYACYVYDFGTKGWFQLQRGFASLAVFEVSTGNLVLIGGGGDGNTYVIDDQTGTYSTVGTLPTATFRTALIDFGDPSITHVFRYLEIEFDSPQLYQSTTIQVWLDPNSVDNPGTSKAMKMVPAKGANRYRAFVNGDATCERALIQINSAAIASTSLPNGTGVIRGIKLAADAVTGLIKHTGHLGGVSPVTISVSPTNANIATNDTQQYAATVTGSSNTAVYWTADTGTINSAGLYTAPGVAGTYHITATSQADPTRSATVPIVVTGGY